MFIPLELNLPLLVGGAIAWYVSTRSGKKQINEERKDRGTLLASGFIAGGALMGVVSAIMRFAGINLVNTRWQGSVAAEALALVAYACIIIYLVLNSMKAANNK
jgi:hypothetical protein